MTGQDLEQGAGIFRIARWVAPDWVISAVDFDARHGYKTSACGFDGYKGHIAAALDTEIITATDATAGTAETPRPLRACSLTCSRDQNSAAGAPGGQATDAAAGQGRPTVYGDAAYGSSELIGRLDGAGIYNGIKCQPLAAVKDHFPEDRFTIDLDGKTVTFPAGVTVPIRPATGQHAGAARFAAPCRTCPLAARCTSAKEGRTITIGPHEAQLVAARQAPGLALATGPPGPRSNARSAISCAAATAAAPRGSAGWTRSPLTLACSSPRSQPGPPRRARSCLPHGSYAVSGG